MHTIAKRAMSSTAFDLDHAYTQAAALITRAQGLIIAAGAGMACGKKLPYCQPFRD